jgi:hypothetical protein
MPLHFVYFGSVVCAEYTSRQSPVHSPALLTAIDAIVAIDALQQINLFWPTTPATGLLKSMPVVLVAIWFSC